MWAIEAATFSGYWGLRQAELPKPEPAKDRVLVRVTAAGVTPLIERVYPFSEAAAALRHLIEDRPFGKVVLTG
jgi:NADPH:quinone reductase-like Zn-dependent oxidoreductase